jgi:phosphoglycolate phosphatase
MEHLLIRRKVSQSQYMGIVDLLECLKSKNCILIVATSKPTVFAEKILQYFKIDEYFDFLCGSNLDGTRSDKSEIISYIFSEKKIEKSLTVMIGDRKHDIIGAQNNGIDSIGVGYGYGSEEELRGIKPTFYVETVEELLQVIS